MKKIFTVAIAMALIITMISSTHRYKIDATVTAINDNTVTFTDCVGYEWEWIAEEGETFTDGEKVILKMYSPIPEKSTRVYDEIVKVIVK